MECSEWVAWKVDMVSAGFFELMSSLLTDRRALFPTWNRDAAFFIVAVVLVFVLLSRVVLGAIVVSCHPVLRELIR